MQSSLKSLFYSGVALLLMAMLFGGLSSLFFLDRLATISDELIEVSINEMHHGMAVQLAIDQAAMPVNDHVIHGGTVEHENYHTQVADVERSLDRLQNLSTLQSEQRKLISESRQDWLEAKHAGEAIMALPDPVGDPVAAEMMEDFDRKIDRVITEFEQFNVLVRDEAEMRHQTMHRLKTISAVFIGLSIIIALLLAVFGVFILKRAFFPPLLLLDNAMLRYRKGDLDFRIDEAVPLEFNTLRQGFNDMADSLRDVHHNLVYESVHDELTGAYNHRKCVSDMHSEFMRAKRYRRPLSILMLDLDHFKAINDKYGHPAGDAMLKAFAREIHALLRETDTFYRYGGEEFIVMLSETDEAESRIVAERIREKVADMSVNVNETTSIQFTVSIGIASFPDSADEDNTLFKEADDAVYQAKNTGRNRVCHFNDMD